jgi:hypothetical protein
MFNVSKGLGIIVVATEVLELCSCNRGLGIIVVAPYA